MYSYLSVIITTRQACSRHARSSLHESAIIEHWTPNYFWKIKLINILKLRCPRLGSRNRTLALPCLACATKVRLFSTVPSTDSWPIPARRIGPYERGPPQCSAPGEGEVVKWRGPKSRPFCVAISSELRRGEAIYTSTLFFRNKILFVSFVR